MNMATETLHDVVVVGGGPAGLSAALVLGRMARKVAVLDSGQPRNHSADSIHGFPTRDGMQPSEFYATARNELARYPVVIRAEAAVRIEPAPGGFRVSDSGGGFADGRRLLIATGISDELPAIEGLRESWGRGVYTCTYCHGWELRDAEVAIMGSTAWGTALVAVQLAGIGASVCVLAQGVDLSEYSGVLGDFDITVKSPAISRVCDLGRQRFRVELADGDEVIVSGLFVTTQKYARADLARDLGCALTEDGRIQVNVYGHTSVGGVFAAGDVALLRRSASSLVNAIAEGGHVGMAIDQDLLAESMRSGSDPVRAR
jgi:thioredoxin reductase